MALKDTFVNFFKKRKKEAETNIKKVTEFKKRFIEEPQKKIPVMALDDLFKAGIDASHTKKKVEETQRKLVQFEGKNFREPIVSGQSAQMTPEGKTSIETGVRDLYKPFNTYDYLRKRGVNVTPQMLEQDMFAGKMNPFAQAFQDVGDITKSSIQQFPKKVADYGASVGGPFAPVHKFVSSIPYKITAMFLGTPEGRAEEQRIKREGTQAEREQLSAVKLQGMADTIALLGTGGMKPMGGGKIPRFPVEKPPEVKLRGFNKLQIEAPKVEVPKTEVAKIETSTQPKGVGVDPLNKILDKYGKTIQAENSGQQMLDSMVSRNISPQNTANKFWSGTFNSLPDTTKGKMVKLLEEHTGMKVGQNGATIQDLVKNIDLGDSVDNLQGTERGFTTLMQYANDNAPKTLSQPETPPTNLLGEEVKTPVAKPAQASMLTTTGAGQATPAELQRLYTKMAVDKMYGKEKTTAALPMETAVQKATLTEQTGGGLFPEKKPATEETKQIVYEAIDSGDIEGAKTLHTELSKTEELPTFEAMQKEVEDANRQTLAEFKPEEKLARVGTEATEKRIKQFKSYIRIAGEKTIKETGMLGREHIPRSAFGVSSDEVADSLGMSESEFMQELSSDVNMASTPAPITPRAKSARIKAISRARTNIAKVRSMAKSLKLDPKFYRIIGDLDNALRSEQLVAVPSIKEIKPYQQEAGVSVEASQKTAERLLDKNTKEAKREQEQIVKAEQVRLREIARQTGDTSVLGKPPGTQARLLGKMIGEATKQGIDVAVAAPYKPNIWNSIRSIIGGSIRDYWETQGQYGKELSAKVLLARRKGDSRSGNANANMQPFLDAMSEEELLKFANYREAGMEGDTPALKAALDAWKEESNKVFAAAEKAGMDVGYTPAYFPHFIPEPILKNIRAQQKALQEVVRMGRARSITEAQNMFNQFVLRKIARRYGNLEKPREVDFPIYEKNPKLVLPSYLDSAWHRISDAEFFGPDDAEAYALIDKLANEGYDGGTSRDMFNLVVGKQSNSQVFKNIESTIGSLHVMSKFTPLTSLANFTQRIETLAWVGPKAFLKSLGKITKEEKTAAIRAGILFEDSKREFIREEGGLNDLTRKYMEIIRFSPIENINRIFTDKVSRVFVKDTFKSLQKTGKDVYRRTLDRMGVNTDKALADGQLSEDDMVNASQYLVDKTQYPYKTEELPYLFNSHPLGRMITRWKSYVFFSSKYKGQLAKLAWEEGRKGNFRILYSILLAYGIAYPIVGEFMNDFWAYLRRKPRDKEGFARYFENLMWVGSWQTDMIRSLQYNNFLGWLAGPDLSTAADATEAVFALFREHKTLEGKEEVKSKLRPLVKFVTRGIPVIGPAVQSVTAKLLEEKKTPAKSKNPFVKSFKNPFGKGENPFKKTNLFK